MTFEIVDPCMYPLSSAFCCSTTRKSTSGWDTDPRSLYCGFEILVDGSSSGLSVLDILAIEKKPLCFDQVA